MQDLNDRQRAMVAKWDQHMTAEFETRDIDAAMATMTAEPFVNHVPVLTGGVGYDAVRSFYGAYFIGHHPADTQTVPIARWVSDGSIVEELTYKFTHTIEMPWMLPGVAPTGKYAEVTIVAVVIFDGDKIAGERIHWDQASVLAQLGLIDTTKLPVAGIEAARKAAEPSSEPSNGLIARGGSTP